MLVLISNFLKKKYHWFIFKTKTKKYFKYFFCNSIFKKYSNTYFEDYFYEVSNIYFEHCLKVFYPSLPILYSD